MKKRIISLLLMIVMIVSIVPFGTISASAAASQVTKEQAVQWVMDNCYNRKIGSGECVALVRAFYAYLGYSVSGNGRDYEKNVMPGWTKIPYQYGVVAQPGDIAVWHATNSEAGKKY